MKTVKIISILFLALLGSIFASTLGINPAIGAVVLQVMHFIPMPAGIMGINAITSKVLIEQRQAHEDRMLEIHNKAKEENRVFNEEEKTEYDEEKRKRNELDPKIKELQEREQLEEESARRAIGAMQKKKENEEIRKYSFMKALRSVVSGENLEGFEREMDQEARKQALQDGIALEGKGIVIPPMILDPNSEKRANELVVGTATLGGNAVATELHDFIGALQNALVFTQLGADFMTGLKGNVQFPIETAVAAATWEGEIDANAQSAPTIGKVSMTPKRLGTYVDIATQLTLQTSPSVEARIRRQMINAIKLGIEQAAINGSGSVPIPEGILSKSGIGSVVGGTNGLIPTWANIVALESKVAIANADVGTLGYLVNAATRGILKSTPKVSGAAGMIWENGATPLNGYKAAVTNAVPSTLTKGTAESICSALIFGNWADLMIGSWSGIEILADPYTKATNGMVRLVVNSFNDIQVGNEKSFAAMKDALTA